jgi:ribonuclease-3
VLYPFYLWVWPCGAFHPDGLYSNIREVFNLTELTKEHNARVAKLEKLIGYGYKNREFALNALIHSSYANEMHPDVNYRNNERLEFLGDAVLDFVMGMMLYNDHQDMSEGEMSKVRALIVCETSLAESAQSIGLGELILLGKGEEVNGGRARASILSDCLEAVIGSIYLDGGMDEAEGFIMELLGETYQKAVNGKLFMDYKTMLQERLQAERRPAPRYSVIETFGPPHRRTFHVEVLWDGGSIRGEGHSIKSAEAAAARAALEFMRAGAQQETNQQVSSDADYA